MKPRHLTSLTAVLAACGISAGQAQSEPPQARAADQPLPGAEPGVVAAVPALAAASRARVDRLARHPKIHRAADVLAGLRQGEPEARVIVTLQPSEAKSIGWIPADTKLAPRPEGIPAWKDIPENERAFQERLMEVYGGFLEHTDVQVGKLIDELEAQKIRDNTLVIYILSDNGASAEGMGGSIAELNAQNGIPSTAAEHIAVAESVGGLRAIGGPRMDNMYHSGWAWAGDSPFRNMKLIAADFGGTRTPMVISWPRRIKPDKTPRPQFHHVNDVAPTLYEILGIRHPDIVDGHKQDPIDGTSFAYTFDSATAPERKKTQYFEIMGSRGIYSEGWMASTFGPRRPWVAELSGLTNWDPKQDRWELFDTRKER